jgi:hypothetical protein
MRRPTKLVAVVTLAGALAGCGAGTALVGVHDAPPQVTTTAPIAPDTAEQIATRVLSKAEEANRAKGEEAQSLREESLTGSALAVANAAAKLETDAPAPTAPLKRSEPPKVLAVSRGTAWPRLIVAQSTAADGGAVLNLLLSPDARTPFRLSATARMHPGASVAALDSVSTGSPILADGTGLAVSPDQLLKEYAGSLTYPKPTPAADVQPGDPFATAVRANAAVQAKAFGKLARLTQVHRPQQGTVAIRLKDGGALVFALMERTDTITLRSGGKSLRPSAEFQRLVRKKTLKKSAQLKSYETVVFTVPEEGKATVVAVDEVLFSAKGA